ncbi:hypothetical protein QL285_010468 [Trifolium repens]|nr:hypothetical protein QL285_010468 [Trifolium repens]
MASKVRKLNISQVLNWPQRANIELTHHSESRVSLKRAILESTSLEKSIARHSEFRARSSPQRAMYSPHRAKAVSDSLMMWQKPTDEERSTRRSELQLAERVVILQNSI